jgi:hypothetical protein
VGGLEGNARLTDAPNSRERDESHTVLRQQCNDIADILFATHQDRQGVKKGRYLEPMECHDAPCRRTTSSDGWNPEPTLC